ncbi:hypothetical protein FA15DRAFT_711811 [Coprinopsis marcescibilis]|uniref:Reverse transcriptase/retrotransposon-derived protein RNase H-like domain-containing protein n=1 Tax=Coprinopsis marcescibilis TaxID=230819 RepID=A0A5C3K9B2_COPMA|nr:hypothetical protein FA15DRAFT_711811 [Coprinopsis marcescibilis]
MFVKDFAARAEPIQKLTRKNEPFIWTEEQTIAQKDLQQAIKEAPILKTIDYELDEQPLGGISQFQRD